MSTLALKERMSKEQKHLYKQSKEAVVNCVPAVYLG